MVATQPLASLAGEPPSSAGHLQQGKPKKPYDFDERRYGDRNGIERMFGRLKDIRRVAMRYDMNANSLMAELCLAALVCNWMLESYVLAVNWIVFIRLVNR